jgi:hypothetical protein
LAASTDVVLDYGVPVVSIAAVKEHLIIERGFQTWWFDGDRDTGRRIWRSLVAP